ncbi:MAG: hypothetical protein BKP49_07980 [Treponema sp. CETP13]|nr:MAG: hypothetical protein BKP49_07980 [Treponema sp. CETP13]
MANFSKGDYLILQNEINNIPLVMEIAHRKGMTICLNPSPYNEKIKTFNLEYVDYFLINEIEAASMAGCCTGNVEQVIKELKFKYPSAKFVITLGKDGVIYFDKNIEKRHGTYDVPVVDTTAAGDTFTGYFIASLSKGIAIEEALELASKASSLAVSKSGAAVSIPNLKTVLESKMVLQTKSNSNVGVI